MRAAVNWVLIQAAKFSWQRAAQETRAVYEQLLVG